MGEHFTVPNRAEAVSDTWAELDVIHVTDSDIIECDGSEIATIG
jgi:hypothetical protein